MQSSLNRLVRLIGWLVIRGKSREKMNRICRKSGAELRTNFKLLATRSTCVDFRVISLTEITDPIVYGSFSFLFPLRSGCNSFERKHTCPHLTRGQASWKVFCRMSTVGWTKVGRQESMLIDKSWCSCGIVKKVLENKLEFFLIFLTTCTITERVWY